MSINSKDISVVVQGVIDKENTSRCLKSIRKYLANSEIILSTWEGSNVNELDFDIVVFNKDPGGTNCSRDGFGVNNVNREIVSTFEGIKKSNRKYVLKLRSDIILKNKNILSINFMNYKRNFQYSFLSSRIMVPAVYSRYFAEYKNFKTPILFHPSDWLYFGLAKDIYALFNIPLTNEPEFSQWFKNRCQERNGYKDTHPLRLWKFSQEAYIWTAYLKKNYHIEIRDKLDIDEEKILLSRQSLVNNFFMADQWQLGIKLAKYNIIQCLMPRNDREGLYTNYHWKREYHKLVNKNYIVIPTICKFLNDFVDFFHIKRRTR